MERPNAIRRFEWLYLGSLAIGLAPLVVDRNAILGNTQEDWMLPVVVGGIAVGTVINLLLWFFIARRRSNVAKWIAVIFCAISVPSLAVMIAEEGIFALGSVLSIVATVLALAAVALLFSPAARAWFRGEHLSGEIADAFR